MSPQVILTNNPHHTLIPLEMVGGELHSSIENRHSSSQVRANPYDSLIFRDDSKRLLAFSKAGLSKAARKSRRNHTSNPHHNVIDILAYVDQRSVPKDSRA